MPGNSGRRGAVRKSTKGSAASGSGGKNRRRLQGKGPTPKAADREYHAAHKRKQTALRKNAARASKRKPANERELVIGRNPIVEALRAGLPAVQIHLLPHFETDDRIDDILRMASERGIPLLEATRTELDELADRANHQGVVMVAQPFGYVDVEDLLDRAFESEEPALLVVLDSITDPRNVGAIIRSVAAFGGHGVVIPERRAASVTASAWKTSAGTAAVVPVAKVTNTVRALEKLKEAGVFVLGLAADGGQELPDMRYGNDPIAIVIGSEGKGLSRLVRETCDDTLSIPMSKAAESLNAGVAAGVTLYEVARQRSTTAGT